MGPIIMERATYLKRVWEDHLSQAAVYERLDPEYAIRRMKKVRHTLETLMKRHAVALGPALTKYFERARRKRRYRVPCLYVLIKLLKNLWKTRPVTDCLGSVTAIYSKWFDHWMAKLVEHLPTHLKDSQDLLARIKILERLPPANAESFTVDIVSMKTNIDTNKAIATTR